MTTWIRLETTQTNCAMRVFWTTPRAVISDVLAPLFEDWRYNVSPRTTCSTQRRQPPVWYSQKVECLVAEQQLWHLFLMFFAGVIKMKHKRAFTLLVTVPPGMPLSPRDSRRLR